MEKTAATDCTISNAQSHCKEILAIPAKQESSAQLTADALQQALRLVSDANVMDEDASILAVLYSQWVDLSDPMSTCDDASAREALIRAMAKAKSRSAKDLSIKLTVWAQLANVDEIDLDKSSPEDALAYSTFTDVFDIAQAMCARENTERKPAGTS